MKVELDILKFEDKTGFRVKAQQEIIEIQNSVINSNKEKIKELTVRQRELENLQNDLLCKS